MSKIPRLSQIAPLTRTQRNLSRYFKQSEKQGVHTPRDCEVAKIVQGDRSGYSITEMNLDARLRLWQVRDHYEDKVNVSDIESKRLVSLGGYVKSRGRGGLSTAWTGLHYLEWDKVHRYKDYEVMVPYELHIPVPVLGNLLAIKTQLDYQLQLRSCLRTRRNSDSPFVSKLIADGFEEHPLVEQYRKLEKDIGELDNIIEHYDTAIIAKRKEEMQYYLRWLDKKLRSYNVEKFFLPMVIKKMFLGEALLDEDYTTHIEMNEIAELFR